jgi:hypothetical protein
MPVLEAMACGLPVIVTSGGPTDEFCPPEAGWRIASTRRDLPAEQLGEYEPAGGAWTLEPDSAHLVELLRVAAGDPAGRLARGRAGRAAAETLSWEAVADRYASRIADISTRVTRRADEHDDPFPLVEDVELRVLATPAWRGHDQLAALLGEWSAATTRETSACLYLLADAHSAGTAEEIEAFVVRAAESAEVSLEACADINVLVEPFRSDRDARLHRAVNAYISLHSGCAGHERLARACGSAIATAGDGKLAAMVAARDAVSG